MEYLEGKTSFFVPFGSIKEKVPPKNPAFFNPLSKINRDISIIIYNIFIDQYCRDNHRTFADAFCGIGSRGLRVAGECKGINQIFFNDINPIAISSAKESSKINSFEKKCIFSIDDVCKFLVRRKDEDRFTIVDLDPFGSPADYVDCLLRSVKDKGLISVTATDTAVLCGVHRKTCFRKYMGYPINTHYCNEIALRLMLSLISHTAARLDLIIRPLFCHANFHYMRVYCQISVNKKESNNFTDNIGYIKHCFKCKFREVSEIDEKKCSSCGFRASIAGPIWIKNFMDKELIKTINNNNLKSGDRNIEKIFNISLNEIDSVPYYFTSDEVSSILKTNPIRLEKIVEKLQQSGHNASKTILNHTGFKTDATLNEILQIIKS